MSQEEIQKIIDGFSEEQRQFYENAKREEAKAKKLYELSLEPGTSVKQKREYAKRQLDKWTNLLVEIEKRTGIYDICKKKFGEKCKKIQIKRMDDDS